MRMWLMGGLLVVCGCATAQAGNAPADPAPEQSPLLGVVRTRDMRLELRGGEQGERYTVTARDGRVLARDQGLSVDRHETVGRRQTHLR